MAESSPNPNPVFFGSQRPIAGLRTIARVVDLALVAALYLFFQSKFTGVAVFAGTIWLLLQDCWGSGQSIGKWLLGLQVVDETTGIGGAAHASCVRNLVFAVAFVTLMVPALWFVFGVVAAPWLALEFYLLRHVPSGLRLGDALAGTHVVVRAQLAHRVSAA